MLTNLGIFINLSTYVRNTLKSVNQFQYNTLILSVYLNERLFKPNFDMLISYARTSTQTFVLIEIVKEMLLSKAQRAWKH